MRGVAASVVWLSIMGLWACGGDDTKTPAPTCSDELKNGDETGVDCGGLSCGKCALGGGCLAATDCASGTCGADGTCGCADGYAPDEAGACADVDDCEPNPCEHGDCTDGVGSFTCACADGYSGPTCALNDDDCTPNPCQNGGTCADGVDTYTCTCATGFYGPTCTDTCDPGHCAPGAVTCDDDGSNRACSACLPGFEGPTCDTEIDECERGDDDCAEDATCTNTEGSFTCACNPGTRGDGKTCAPCAAGEWGEQCEEVCRKGSCTR